MYIQNNKFSRSVGVAKSFANNTSNGYERNCFRTGKKRKEEKEEGLDREK